MNKGLAKALIILIMLVVGLTFHFGFKLGSHIWEGFTVNQEGRLIKDEN